MASCWCGSTNLAFFSEDYLRCEVCQTLVLARMPDADSLLVRDDEHDYYGAQYYERVLPQLGYSSLGARARSDLAERCIHWLRYLLRHKLPPGRTLELGCAHGGFVALLRAAGFDATGLELSPSLCDFARRNFDVPVLTGPVEAQNIAVESLDAIVLMDVLEHLPDPVRTMAHCVRLLKSDGILLIQTPRRPEGKSLEEMRADGDRFIEQLKPDQHLYLFSESSVRLFLERLGLQHLAFEPAIFAHYDMFLAAGREPLKTFEEEAVRSRLENSPAARVSLALLDVDTERREAGRRLQDAECDRANRLVVIHELESRLRELDAANRSMEAHSRGLESQIRELWAAHNAVEARAKKAEELARSAQERAIESDRRAAELSAQALQQRRTLDHQTGLLNRIYGSHVYKSMRRLGLWGWLAAPPPPEEACVAAPSPGKQLRRVAVDLTPVLPGGANGGAKVVIMELMRHLANLAPECEFVLLTHERTHEELSVLDRANVRRVCVIGERASQREKIAMQSRAALAKVLPAGVLDRASAAYRGVAGSKSAGVVRQAGADVLFCPFTAPFFFEPGTPVVSLVHDLQCASYPQFFSPAEREERMQNFQRACRVASKVVCVSEFVRATVLENSALAPERVVAVHTRTASRLSRTSLESREQVLARLGLAAEDFLLYPANFWPHKNHEMLLTAAGMYAAAHPESELKLVLTGAPGPRRDDLMDASRQMGLAGRVIFPGFVPELDLAALMDGCLAVIFPSLFEGFGLPLLEAMAANKPVLASNVTSLPEVGGDGVLYFDPRRPSEIVAAIERIESDSELRETLRARGRQRVADFGGPEKMAAEYLAVLREAVSGPAILDPGIYGLYEDGWAGERITIAYAGNGKPQQLRLEVSVPPWAPMQALSLTVTPVSPGTPQHHRVKRGEAVTISRPLREGPGTLELHCAPTFQPKACAMGDDIRMLSCHILRAHIASADGHTTDLKAMSHAV